MKHQTEPSGGFLPLGELCRRLSISKATAKNWIRLGKLEVQSGGAEEPRFSRRYVEELEQKIRSGELPWLKSRRNKLGIREKSLYRDYISHPGNRQAVEEILTSVRLAETDRERGAQTSGTGGGPRGFTDRELRAVLANAAMQLYSQAKESGKPRTEPDMQKQDEVFRRLLCDLLETGSAAENGTLARSASAQTPTRMPAPADPALAKKFVFVPGEDTLGFIYLSLRDMNHRKNSGAYYTPSAVADRLLEEVKKDRESASSICDPCCGTGNFLLRLAADGAGLEALYGQDVDPLSVALLRINLFLQCPQTSPEILYTHFICGDTLRETFSRRFDLVLGNPPWGGRFSPEETEFLLEHYRTAGRRGTESCDVFVEKALSMLERGGTLAFVLPEAVLTVASHRKVRELLWEKASFRFAVYLKQAFHGVQCPAVILGLRLDGKGETAGCRVSWNADGACFSYTVGEERRFEDGMLSFHITDEEDACLRAMEEVAGAVSLKNNARFALGIVTGDNRGLVRSREERSEVCEPVLRGSDIFRYAVRPSGNYLEFEPGRFQQTAPEECYRAPEKLVYRFIGEMPVFARDAGRTLTLNSCNILIPQVEGMGIKYILAILNSRAAAFYMERKFNSVKMLRSHLEKLPVPPADEKTKREIEESVERLERTPDDFSVLYDALDQKIMELYGLGEKEKKMIWRSLEGKNLFFPR